MKITESTARKIIIESIPNLDPIALYLEDMHVGAGKVTITAFNDSWTYYWSHMGNHHTLKTFLLQAKTNYIVGKLLRTKTTEIDSQATIKSAMRQIGVNRRAGDIDAEDARQAYDELMNMGNMEEEVRDGNTQALITAFGEDFWDGFIFKPSREYEHCSRVVTAIKEALPQIK